MEDKMLMEGILWDTKVLADLCLHGSMESATEDVHKTFLVALKDVLHMQNEIYNVMSENGWYSSDNVTETKLTQAKQKFQKLAKEE